MAHVLSRSALVALPLLLGTSLAQADAILLQKNDGDVYRLDLSTGSTSLSLFKDLDNLGGTEEFSPNALGNAGGTLFRANFAGDQNIYKENDSFADPTVDGGGIAAGAVSGSTYYFLDGAGNLGSLNTTNALGTSVELETGYFPTPASLGDLVVLDNGNILVSSSNGLQEFDTGGNLITDYGDPTLSGSSDKFAGMAFSNGTLYGVTFADGMVYSIDLSSGPSASASVTELYDLEDKIWTDAAVVPIPAAVWLFGSALVGMVGVGYRGRRRNA